MFEFRCVVAFCVDIGDFLELECPFEGDGIHVATADEERVVVIGVGLGDLSNRSLVSNTACTSSGSLSISSAI